MDQGLIPRRYAKALFEEGQQRGQNAPLYELMQTLTASFAAAPELQQTMSNPFVADADKVKLILTASGAGDKAPGLFTDFLKLLERNRRVNLIRAIAQAFVDLYRKENHIYAVVVESAAPLSDAVRKRLTDLIGRHIGDGTLECTFNVNPAVIGGFTVKVGNELLDASVRTQLQQIRLSLLK